MELKDFYIDIDRSNSDTLCIAIQTQEQTKRIKLDKSELIKFINSKIKELNNEKH